MGEAPQQHLAGHVIRIDEAVMVHGSNNPVVEYGVIRLLGRGAFGCVYEVAPLLNGVRVPGSATFAMKHVDLQLSCKSAFLDPEMTSLVLKRDRVRYLDQTTPCSRFMEKIFREVDVHVKASSANGVQFFKSGRTDPTSVPQLGEEMIGVPVIRDYFFSIPQAQLDALARDLTPANTVKQQGRLNGASLYIVMDKLPYFTTIPAATPLVYGNELFRLVERRQLVSFAKGPTGEELTDEEKELKRQSDTDGLMEGLYQICEAMARLHEKNIISRDFRYTNVFIARDAQGVVSGYTFDFGLAKDTEISNPHTGGLSHEAVQAPEMKEPPSVVWKIRAHVTSPDNACQWTDGAGNILFSLSIMDAALEGGAGGEEGVFQGAVAAATAGKMLVANGVERLMPVEYDANGFFDLQVIAKREGFEISRVGGAVQGLVAHVLPWERFMQPVVSLVPEANWQIENERLYTNKVDSYAFAELLDWLFFGPDARDRFSYDPNYGWLDDVELATPPLMADFIKLLKKSEGLYIDPISGTRGPNILFADPVDRPSIRDALQHPVWAKVLQRRAGGAV